MLMLTAEQELELIAEIYLHNCEPLQAPLGIIQYQTDEGECIEYRPSYSDEVKGKFKFIAQQAVKFVRDFLTLQCSYRDACDDLSDLIFRELFVSIGEDYEKSVIAGLARAFPYVMANDRSNIISEVECFLNFERRTGISTVIEYDPHWVMRIQEGENVGDVFEIEDEDSTDKPITETSSASIQAIASGSQSQPEASCSQWQPEASCSQWKPEDSESQQQPRLSQFPQPDPFEDQQSQQLTPSDSSVSQQQCRMSEDSGPQKLGQSADSDPQQPKQLDGSVSLQQSGISDGTVSLQHSRQFEDSEFQQPGQFTNSDSQPGQSDGSVSQQHEQSESSVSQKQHGQSDSSVSQQHARQTESSVSQQQHGQSEGFESQQQSRLCDDSVSQQQSRLSEDSIYQQSRKCESSAFQEQAGLFKDSGSQQPRHFECSVSQPQAGQSESSVSQQHGQPEDFEFQQQSGLCDGSVSQQQSGQSEDSFSQQPRQSESSAPQEQARLFEDSEPQQPRHFESSVSEQHGQCDSFVHKKQFGSSISQLSVGSVSQQPPRPPAGFDSQQQLGQSDSVLLPNVGISLQKCHGPSESVISEFNEDLVTSEIDPCDTSEVTEVSLSPEIEAQSSSVNVFHNLAKRRKL